MTRDPEFLLLLAACRATFASGVEHAFASMANGVDWQRLLAMAARHRVDALAWHSLAPSGLAIPPAVADQLSERAARIVERNLRAALECAALAKAFARAGIDLLFVKGLTLGALAYGTPYLKMGWDIDLLVAPDRVGDAAVLLATAGYAPTTPAAPGDLPTWHRRHKESAWYKPDGEFHLDLHSRLSDHRGLIPRIGMVSPRQTVTVAPGIELATLAGDELFAYLCVHGASSAWFRLKWITDLAGLLRDADGGEIDRLYRRARQDGAGRAAGQALLLAERLYRLPLGAPLRDTLERDTATRWLAAVAMTQLAGRRDLKEPTERWFGTLSIHVSQLVIEPGWRPLIGELARQAGDLIGLR